MRRNGGRRRDGRKANRMNDLISRQMVIDFADELGKRNRFCPGRGRRMTE